jgi:D-alanyl-lipoteichoic acid acyltransferase DltB (MBOAT superfamily)
LLFTSFGFLVLLAITTAVYYLFPERYRWVVLLISSAVFYAYYGVHNAVCLSATILTTYTAARVLGFLHERREAMIANNKDALSREEKQAIRKRNQGVRRVFLAACLIINLGFLALVKLDGSLIMPVGVSFYTFRAAGYLIDVYRGEAKAERNLPRFMLFCAFFPHMIMGPISRYNEVAPTLLGGNRFDIENLSAGARRVLFGFFKKLVIADRAAVAVDLVYADSGEFGGAAVAFAVFLYSVQLYCDFSGGIDITRGAAKMFGIELISGAGGTSRCPRFSGTMCIYR